MFEPAPSRRPVLPFPHSAGLHVFLSSVVVQGFSGDQLFLASDRDRRLVLAAMDDGLATGCVQPIHGAKTFSSPTVASLKDALWSVVGSISVRGSHFFLIFFFFSVS